MVRRMTDLFAMAVIGVVAIPVFSQAPAAKPSFEVVSVKPNNSGSGSSSTNTNQGRFLATNVTVKTLMMQAYRLQDFQIIGDRTGSAATDLTLRLSRRRELFPYRKGRRISRNPTASIQCRSWFSPCWKIDFN